MKLEECERMAREFVQDRKNSEDIHITGVKRKTPEHVEVKGTCEGKKFTVELNVNQAEVTAYDFSEDIGEFGPSDRYRLVRE